MNLVHVRLQLPQGTAQFAGVKQVFLRHVAPGGAVEHISAHPGSGGELTMGFWVNGVTVVESERIAYAVAQRVLEAEPALSRARITSCSSALVPPVFDEMVRSTGDPGRYMRWTDAEGGEG
ncbi:MULTISPECIES: hypothetical protein [unclassified Streptomyces]|uniref:hypothetical protein n=1 Tax=unclassified Streptomyces TaxID=2593676 RepID=UPI000CD49B71|nr:hypothetical protein [Streptomyces sp. SM10]